MRVTNQSVRSAFKGFVADPRYPCLAAKGLAAGNDYTLQVFGSLGSAAASHALAVGLGSFVRDAPRFGEDGGLPAFVAVFTGRPPRGEAEFDRRVWMQLQRLHGRDGPSPAWDSSVSDDSDDPRFAFSFAGCALFVIGLHPGSSRLARRFAWRTLVFNPHAQFERLRREGLFERLRDRIRERDVALQGPSTPSVAEFGKASEARQYSGRTRRTARGAAPSICASPEERG